MARKKRRTARTPRRPAAVAAPLWLAQLRADVFRDPAFPALDPAYLVPSTGQAVVCDRRIEFHGGRLHYVEVWRHPHSLAALHRWSRELDMASFLAGVGAVRTNAIAILRQTAQAMALQWHPHRPPQRWELAHEAFGRRTQGGWR